MFTCLRLVTFKILKLVANASDLVEKHQPYNHILSMASLFQRPHFLLFATFFKLFFKTTAAIIFDI